MSLRVPVATHPSGIYDSRYVRELFDTMSDSYERFSCVLSGGMSVRWRHAIVRAVARLVPTASEASALAAATGAPPVVLDLLTGQGENWAAIRRGIPGARLIGLDFSEGMLARARHRIAQRDLGEVELLQEDALQSSVASASVDVVVCAYGLKTFSAADGERLAGEVARILKPGGRFGFVEISWPHSRVGRAMFRAHVGRLVPFVARRLAGDDEPYRMLSHYVERFGSVAGFAAALRARGLSVQELAFSGGLATGAVGTRPLVAASEVAA